MSDGNVFVRYIHGFPLSVRGITTPNADGTFSVYINADLPQEAQKAACEHELYHIEHDHLYNLDPVSKNECEANGMPLPAPLPDDALSETVPAVFFPPPEPELKAEDRYALFEWVYEMLYGTEQLRRFQAAMPGQTIYGGGKQPGAAPR